MEKQRRGIYIYNYIYGQSQVVTESKIGCSLLNNSFIKKALISSYIWLERACEVLYYGIKFI